MKKLKEYLLGITLISMYLHLHDDTVTQTTLLTGTGNDLSPEMKTYYSKDLIRLAGPKLVHDKYAQKRNIPKNGGKTIEFRLFSTLGKATTPLTEGVTPTGNKLTASTVTATVKQYGDWIRLSDVLMLTAIDPILLECNAKLADQAGRTLDTITRDEINKGTNVNYAPAGSTEVTSRQAIATTSIISMDLFNRAAAKLKTMNAPTINGRYEAIIHPYVAYDLMKTTEWLDSHKYAQPQNIYDGDLGIVGNVHFNEASEAKIFRAADLSTAARTLTVKTTLSEAGVTIAIDEVLTTADATALVGRKVMLGTSIYTVASASAAAAGSATITMTTAVSVANGTDGVVLYPGEHGYHGCSVYSTLVHGSDAFATTSIEGGGLQYIFKPLGSGDDPLNQRATSAWKALKAVAILADEYMVRIESCSSFATQAAN